MTESERLAKVIYRAWISPFPDEADFAEFHDALKLYADACEQDLQAARMEAWKKSIETGIIDAAGYPGSIRIVEPEPKTDRPPEGMRYEDVAPPAPADTHTNTQPGRLTAKA